MRFQRASYTSIFGCHYAAARFADDPVLGPVVRPIVERYREVARDLSTSPLPNRPQLCAALVTSDGMTLVVKRSAKVLIDPGRRDTSVVGGIKPQKGDCEASFAVPFATILRQAREELGIVFDPRLAGSVVITAIAQDESRLYQPAIVMALFTPLRMSWVLYAIERHAPDKWEGEAWIPVPFNPTDVGRMLLEAEEMNGMGKLAFLGVLGLRFPLNEIVQALS